MSRVRVIGPTGEEFETTQKRARLLSLGREFRIVRSGPRAPQWEPNGLQATRPIRVLSHLHRYPPTHQAGAEMMLHTLLKFLVARGHEAHVITRDGGGKPEEYEGILEIPLKGDLREFYRWTDVVVTHLDCTRDAVALAHEFGKPVVHLVHNDRQLDFNEVNPDPDQFVVFNSAWLARAVPWSGRWTIVSPVVDPEEYRTKRGEAVTLVNLTQEKGAQLFYDLAKQMRPRRFLGVRGAYGRQLPPPRLQNLTIEQHTPDMRSIYGRTRVVLMPSGYESWGRVGIEAAASGIPTIAQPTPGLRESLGEAGIFVDRTDPQGYAAAIERLDDPKEYAAASQRALKRSRELDPTKDLERFESVLVSAIAENEGRESA